VIPVTVIRVGWFRYLGSYCGPDGMVYIPCFTRRGAWRSARRAYERAWPR